MGAQRAKKKAQKKTAKAKPRQKAKLVRKTARKRVEVAIVRPKRLSKRLQEKRVSDLILNHRENGRKLARSILRRWQVTMPAEEVDSLVDLTLCEAARRYSDEKGASFITFLFYHLRGHLVRAVANAANEANIFLALAQGAGADTSGWTSAAEAAWVVVPELYIEGQRTAESPENLLMQKEKATLCRDACISLDDLEKQIIDRTYAQDEALVDIARSLGYSRCHISRVKKRALKRLRSFISDRTHEELPPVEDEGEEMESKVRRHRRRRITIIAEREAEQKAA